VLVNSELENLEGKKLFGRPRRRWKDNIKLDVENDDVRL
jgi:hypothetical protein